MNGKQKILCPINAQTRKMSDLIKKKTLKLYTVAGYSQTNTSSETPPTGKNTQ